MRYIYLSNSDLRAIIDDEDYAVVNQHNWYLAVNDTGHKSVRASVDGKSSIGLHRLITGNYTANTIDHKNGNTLDNQRANLRPATHSQNARNRQISTRNTSGYKGVSVYSGRGFAAGIRVNNRQIHLGFYQSAKDAAKRYNEAAKTHFGDFAYLNQVED